MLVTKQLMVAIDLHSMENKYFWSQWLPSAEILQNIFILCKRKKETRTGLEQVEGE